MAKDGTAIKDIFYMIPDNNFAVSTTPIIDLPISKKRECCGNTSFKVLADINTEEEFKNDKKGFLWWFNDVVNVVDLTLQRFNTTTGEYTDICPLNGTIDVGYFYPLGFFKNSANEVFIGYVLYFKRVLGKYGAGSYKVRLDATTAIGDSFTIYSDEYCLKQYTPSLANGTFRFDYTLNGIMGVNENDSAIRDYGNLQWQDSIRWNGYFAFVKSTFVNDYTRYNDGSRQWVKDEQEPEFKLLIKSAPWKLHELIRTDVLQADEILVTDYNMNNFKNYIQKSVQKTSEYPPKFFQNQSKLASVELTFRQAINNLKKLRG